MATVATPAMRQFAQDWEDAIDGATRRDDAATISGIVGDAAHDGGYHISREDNDPDDYSVELPEDQEGDSDWASAVDMNMIPSQMSIVTQRLLDSARDQNDPRLNYCREFYGTVNGTHVVGWDTYYGQPATSDESHLWHVHLSVLRKYANDADALNAVLSVITGEPWENGGGGGTVSDDYGPYGKPDSVEDRTVAVMLADVWGQEREGVSPYDGVKTYRSAQLDRIEEKLDALLNAPKK